MPSSSLRRWLTSQRIQLDDAVARYGAVGRTGPGRRYATEQASHFYAVLLSAHFQGFCRDLHSECVQRIAQEIPASLQNVVRGWFQHSRKLDRGNPNPKNITEDFGRLGLVMWDKVKALDSKNEQRRHLLEELNKWRNAIVQQDFDPTKIGGGGKLRLQDVTGWRKACDQLARAFDEVTAAHLGDLLGSRPW